MKEFACLILEGPIASDGQAALIPVSENEMVDSTATLVSE